MYIRAMSLVHRIRDHLITGNVLAATEDYVFPLPVQIGDDITVLRSPAEFAAALLRFYGQKVASGRAPCNPKITAIDIPRNGRFRMWVDWTYPDVSNLEDTYTRTIYYCSVLGSRVQIEMVQFLRLSNTTILHSALSQKQTA